MRASNKTLLFFLSIFGLTVLSLFNTLPSYLFFAFLFLIIPSTYFLFRREKTLDEKKYLLIVLISLIGGLVWDTIALHFQLWNFPKQTTLIWLFGLPLEEFIFFITFPTITLGIYSTLPQHRKKKIFSNEPKIKDAVMLLVIFALQIGVFTSMVFFGMSSYIKWLLFFAGFPSAFYLFRKGEKIDELNLAITVVIWVVYMLLIDPFFIISRAWYYGDATLIGKIWIIPIDDLLFVIFCAILTIGIYTSIPKKLLKLGQR